MKERLLLLLLMSILCLSCGISYAQEEANEVRQRMERLEKEIGILDRQIRDNQSKKADALSRLSLLQTKIRTREALVKESDEKVAGLDRQISAKRKEIAALQSRLDTMEFYYSRLVKNAYVNRNPRVWYMYILASENISQGISRYSFFRNLSRQMRSQAEEIISARSEIEAQKADLEKSRKEVDRERSRKVIALQALKDEERELKNLSSSLSRQKTKYQRDLSSKKRQAAALEAEIKRAIGSAMGSSKSKTSKTAAPIDYQLADKFASNRGKLPWPVSEGAVTSRFGKQFHSVFKSLQMPANNGISLAVPPETQVKSVFDGVVAQITILPGYHQCILVQHGNFFTLYCKIKNVYVKAGQKVKTEDYLGTVDTIDGETVFHFEIWNEKTQPQNPETWLRPR